MAQEANTTFQKVFSLVTSTDSIKLLSWCVSSTVPFSYMGEALATAMQQDEKVLTTAAAPEPEGSPALGPSSRPAFPTGTPPTSVPLLPDIPFVGTPPMMHPFLGPLPAPHQKVASLPQQLTQ